MLTSGATGKTIFMGMVYAGQSKHWTERHAVKLEVDNPAGVVVTVNGSRNKILRGDHDAGAPEPGRATASSRASARALTGDRRRS